MEHPSIPLSQSQVLSMMASKRLVLIFFFLKKNFMAPFYGWGSTASRLQSHYKKTVYFLPLRLKKFLILIWLSHPVVLNKNIFLFLKLTAILALDLDKVETQYSGHHCDLPEFKGVNYKLGWNF